MTRRYILSAAACAAATCALAVAVFLPRPLGAVDQTKSGVPNPKLTIGYVQLSVIPAEDGAAVYKAGDIPQLLVKAENTGSESAEVQVRVSIEGREPMSEMSRRPMLPTTLWQTSRTISVAPGQATTIPLNIDKPLPAGRSISVVLASGQKAIMAMSISTVVPNAPRLVQIGK